MNQKAGQLVIIILVLLHNTVLANVKQTNDNGLLKAREKAIQLVKLWDSVNYHPSNYKDPYSIEIWDQLLSEQYALAIKNKDLDLVFKLSIPLSFTYHYETKFKKGIPLLEAILIQKEKLDTIQYKEVLIVIEEEYRASNNIEKAIKIRKERIENHFINNYWEIYRDCGLYNAAKNDLLQFVKIPVLHTTKRLNYYFLLGGLYMDMKEIDSAKKIYTIALREVEEMLILNKKTSNEEDQKILYWKGCFMGLIVKCNIEKGDYSNSIPTLKFNIFQSFENSDNKISAMNTLSKVFIHFKQFKEAKIYLDSATILLTEKTSNTLEVAHLLTTSDYYAAINKNDSAFYYYKKYNNKKQNHTKMCKKINRYYYWRKWK